MKKLVWMIVPILIAAVFLGGCNGPDTRKAYSYNKDKTDLSFLDANGGFAFDIFREINKEDKEKSIFISPLSISTALSMTYQGARGTTKDSMAQALGYRGLDMNTLNDSYKNLLPYLMKSDKKVTLDINNSIWIREGEDINRDFVSLNKDVFNAYITELDFRRDDAAKTINKWIDNSTKGKITEMVQGPISEDILMYLINAIYFKGDWEQKFDKKNTFATEFNQGDNRKTQVDMMMRNGKIEYGSGDDYQVVRLPYGNGTTAMYCILPKEGLDINKFIDSMSLDKWSQIKDGMDKKEDVLVQIPKFKLEYGIKELKNSLSSLGMGEAFSDNADFSGIRENTTISRVLHKAVVEVNEEGSEAAAVTVVEVRLTSAMPSEPVKFIADRPFLFIIADDQADAILFMGKLYSIE